jgi:hypothetical protein
VPLEAIPPSCSLLAAPRNRALSNLDAGAKSSDEAKRRAVQQRSRGLTVQIMVERFSGRCCGWTGRSSIGSHANPPWILTFHQPSTGIDTSVHRCYLGSTEVLPARARLCVPSPDRLTMVLGP